MTMPPLRPQHWLLFAAVALLFFAWGAWLMRTPPPAEPLPWLAEWRSELLTPLADERLNLAQVSRRVAGELWLQPRPDGARLLYRGEWRAGGESWALEAELGLSEAERDSLMAAAGLGVKDAEQSLGAQLLAGLGRQAVAGLSLRPLHAVAAERLAASLGQPRLRLELAEGQAWVYPELGLTAYTDDGQLRLLQVVPRRLVHQRRSTP